MANCNDTILLPTQGPPGPRGRVGPIGPRGYIGPSGLVPTTIIANLQDVAADIVSHPVHTITEKGVYRICAYALTKIPDVTAGIISTTFSWTDDFGGTGINLSGPTGLSLSAPGYIQFTVVAECLASTDISLQLVIAGIYGTATYNFYATIEQLCTL